jgi:hypothetical protein
MRETDYANSLKDFMQILENNAIWVLSTSRNDYVTSRSMSIIHIGTILYFQTHNSYLKHLQMSENANVALCAGNCSIEGTAECIGSWNDERNGGILQEYQRHHKGSYDKYGSLDGQVVYKVTPKTVRLWEYVNSEPTRREIRIAEQKAFELAYL